MNPVITAAERPLALLTEAAHAHPGVWKTLDGFHAMRGQDGLPHWPDWCYVPIAAGVAAVTGGGNPSLLPMGEQIRLGRAAAHVTGLAAWRMSKGVYEFDPDLLVALWDTNQRGALPAEVLFRLPQWGLYVTLGQPDLAGFFVWLESDAQTGDAELRFLLDWGAQPALTGLESVTVHLHGTLEDGINAAVTESALDSRQVMPDTALQGVSEYLTGIAAPLVNLTLYLCSEAPDYSGRTPPANPTPKRVKGGARLFPADGPTTWGVGERIGAAIRRGREHAAQEDASTGERTRPRAHVRAAHWHLYWTGPRSGKRVPIVKWLPPTLVAAETPDPDELPAVVRRVREE